MTKRHERRKTPNFNLATKMKRCVLRNHHITQDEKRQKKHTTYWLKKIISKMFPWAPVEPWQPIKPSAASHTPVIKKLKYSLWPVGGGHLDVLWLWGSLLSGWRPGENKWFQSISGKSGGQGGGVASGQTEERREGEVQARSIQGF